MSSVVIILLRQRDLVDRFRDAGATSAEAAKPLSDIGVRMGFIFSRLSARGVFVHAGGDRWWHDAAAWNHYRDGQGRRLLIAAVVISAISLLLLCTVKMFL